MALPFGMGALVGSSIGPAGAGLPSFFERESCREKSGPCRRLGSRPPGERGDGVVYVVGTGGAYDPKIRFRTNGVTFRETTIVSKLKKVHRLRTQTVVLHGALGMSTDAIILCDNSTFIPAHRQIEPVIDKYVGIHPFGLNGATPQPRWLQLITRALPGLYMAVPWPNLHTNTMCEFTP
jgi:hypothetical protein